MTADLTSRSLLALKWSYLGSGIRVGSQLLIGAVLARLLGPQSFGLAAIAMVIVGFGNLFSDFGLSAALIQSRSLTEENISYAFVVQIGVGLSMSLAGQAFAPLISYFFQSPAATPLIRVMSWMFVLQSLGQTSNALLIRGLRFRRTQSINALSYIAGYGVVGILLATAGVGPWSLVAAQLVQTTFSSLAFLSMRPPSWPQSGMRRMPGLFHFGGLSMAANFLSWTVYNVDNIVVGRFFGSSALGIYMRATNIAMVPSTAASGLQSVLFAASSEAQASFEKVKNGFLACTAAISLFCFPVLITVAIVPDVVVLGVYGTKWIGVIAILPALAVAGCFNVLLMLAGPVLLAMRYTRLEVVSLLLTVLAMIPAMIVGASVSLLTVAWAIVIIYALRCVLLLRSVISILDISLSQYADALLRAGPPTLLAAGSGFAAAVFLRHAIAPPLVLASVVTSAGLAASVAVRIMGGASLSEPLYQLLHNRGYRMPKSLQWWLRL